MKTCKGVMCDDVGEHYVRCRVLKRLEIVIEL